MRDVFLGKPWHWVLLAIVFGLMWATGEAKMHVIRFNPFILSILTGATVVLLLVLKTTKPDEQITRDPLPDPNDDESGGIFPQD